MVLAPLILSLWAVVVVERNLAPLVIKVAEVRAKAWAIETIARVINEEIIPGLTYENLVRLERDTSGRIAFMQPDTLEINRVMAKAVASIQGELRHSEEFRVMVPLNQALGTELFINVGPRIPAYVTAVGTVQGDISEEFSEAGINQTRHVIYLQIRTQMSIVIPMVRSAAEVSTKLVLVQAVIVGDVPHTYVRIGR
jgi:sporulation protein YunB